MARKKRGRMQLRFYEQPESGNVLALYGDEWRRYYGEGADTLHFHNLMELGCCREGEGTLLLDERELRYGPGMISIIPHNYPHTTISDDGTLSLWEYLFFEPEHTLRELYPGNQARRTQILQRVNHNAFLLAPGADTAIARTAETILDLVREKKEFYQECVRNQLTSLVLLIARLNPKQSIQEIKKLDASGEQILPALYYIERRYMEPIRIEDLAKLCNMSETNFRRVFRAATNLKPLDYLNTVRVQNACSMIRSSSDSMKDIAVKAGFGTVSTFNRDFKKILGISPCQWKKNPEHYEEKLLHYHISALRGW